MSVPFPTPVPLDQVRWVYADTSLSPKAPQRLRIIYGKSRGGASRVGLKEIAARLL